MTPKTSFLAITCAFGFVVAAACGPSKPAENADGAGGTPSATASADATAGAGATEATGGAGGAATGGADAGGSAPTGTATTSGTGAATGGTTGPAPKPAALVASADAANGGKLFEKEGCVGCHGTKAKGPNAKFPNLYKMKWSDEAQIEKAFAAIKKGKAPMPPYEGKLDDKQIADLIAFVKTAK